MARASDFYVIPPRSAVTITVEGDPEGALAVVGRSLDELEMNFSHHQLFELADRRFMLESIDSWPDRREVRLIFRELVEC